MNILLAGNCSTEKSSNLVCETRANIEAKGHNVFVAKSFEELVAILRTQEIEWGVIDPWLPTSDQGNIKAVIDLYRKVFLDWLPDQLACLLGGLLVEGEFQKRLIPGTFFDTRMVEQEKTVWILPSGEKVSDRVYSPLQGYMFSRRREQWFKHWIDSCPCCALVGL